MKPTVKDGYLMCLGIFKPEDIDSDIWSNLTSQQRTEKMLTANYRVRVDEIGGWNEYEDGTVTLRNKNINDQSVLGDISEYDKILIK